ncbi:hypothetical protein [Rhodococcus sp. DN22]|uniref:hypothetical protein n=1 Tax=Rhodococcus sp. DN22 TaxID=357684 RepID=UPI0030D3E6D6
MTTTATPDSTAFAAAPATPTPPTPRRRLYGSRVLTGEMILIALLSFVDVILLKALADVVVNDDSGGGILSWMLAIGVSGIGLVVAASAGMMQHDEKPGYRATLAAWLTIGAAVACLRALTGQFTGDNSHMLSDIAQAVLMLALYIAAGWRMTTLAPEVLDTNRHELATAKRVRDRAIGGRQARLEEQYTRHHQAARRCDDARIQVDRDLQYVERLIAAYRDQLNALARNEITKAMANPEDASGIYRSAVNGNPGRDGKVFG